MKQIIEIIKANKLLLYAIVILILIIVVSEAFICLYLNEKISNIKIPNNTLIEKEVQEETKLVNKIVVDIKGEVNAPGTYEVSSDKRVIDVIKLAKGLTKNADTKANNLSKYVMDEMVITIYSKEQIKDFIETKTEEETINNKCNEESISSYNSCLSEKSITKNNLININSATKEELISLTGIGESKANAIIEYRKNNALFTTIEDIKNVSGISDSIYDQIKNFITI